MNRDIYMLGAQSGDAPGPFSLDRGAPFEREAELDEEVDGGIEVLDHDADVVHSFDCHDASLAFSGLRCWGLAC
jgi:hypothetical protein